MTQLAERFVRSLTSDNICFSCVTLRGKTSTGTYSRCRRIRWSRRIRRKNCPTHSGWSPTRVLGSLGCISSGTFATASRRTTALFRWRVWLACPELKKRDTRARERLFGYFTPSYRRVTTMIYCRKKNKKHYRCAIFCTAWTTPRRGRGEIFHTS